MELIITIIIGVMGGFVATKLKVPAGAIMALGLKYWVKPDEVRSFCTMSVGDVVCNSTRKISEM